MKILITTLIIAALSLPLTWLAGYTIAWVKWLNKDGIMWLRLRFQKEEPSSESAETTELLHHWDNLWERHLLRPWPHPGHYQEPESYYERADRILNKANPVIGSTIYPSIIGPSLTVIQEIYRNKKLRKS